MDAHLLYTSQNPPPPANPSPSPITLSTLLYLPRESLASTLRASPLSKTSTHAVVDVRDSDHIGGHIKGSIHAPAPDLDWRIPELVRTLEAKEVVVFHCALSQQRGPGAAVRYLRERERVGLGKTVLEVEGKGVVAETDGAGEGSEEADGKEKKVEQRVYVLDGGFVKWQEKYGKDERLTEGYAKELWESGYFY